MIILLISFKENKIVQIFIELAVHEETAFKMQIFASVCFLSLLSSKMLLSDLALK